MAAIEILAQSVRQRLVATGKRLIYASAREQVSLFHMPGALSASGAPLGASKMSTRTRVRYVLGLTISASRSARWSIGAVVMLTMLAGGGAEVRASSGTSVRIQDKAGQVTEIVVPDGSTVEVREDDQVRPFALELDTDRAWSPTGSLNVPRSTHTATRLADGTVLVAGGATDGGVIGTCERYDPATGKWSPTGDWQGPARSGHAAVLLSNGQVLVAGGRTNWGGGQPLVALDVCELYDPKTGQWSPTANLSTPRSSLSLTLLDCGKVLAVGGQGPGGQNLKSCELYDPATGKWRPTGDLGQVHQYHAAVRLPQGKAMVIGGQGAASCEVYDPTTGAWSATGSMTSARCTYGNAAVLDDGRVLVAGGYPHTTSCEIYDPAGGKWSRTGELGAQIAGGVLTPMPGGDILHTGGWLPDSRGSLGTAARFDPLSGQWRQVEPASVPRDSQTATLLESGRVLVVGGLNSAGAIALCQIYNPAAPERGVPLFDGKSLAGWQANPAWKVEGGAIVCPTSQRIRHLPGRYRIHGPFEFTYDIQLLRLRVQDAKGITLRAADGRKLAVVRLDDKPDVFHIRSQTKVTANVPLQTGKWYHIRCRLDADGKFTAWLDGSHQLETTVPVQFPLTVGLECERSGARFRNLELREDATGATAVTGADLPDPQAFITYNGDLTVDTLQDGVKAFANRDYTFQDIPKPLLGLRFVRQNGGEGQPYELHVSKAGAVLAVTQASNTAMHFMQSRGWTLTPWRFRYTGVGRTRLIVWQKQLDVGVEYVPALLGSWFPTMVIMPPEALPQPLALIEYCGDLTVDTLRDSASAFANRRYTFQKVPQPLVGLRFVRQSGGVAQAYDLHVKKPGTVLAATTVADEAVQQMKKRGWKRTSWRFMYTDPYDSPLIVWQRRVDVGVIRVLELAQSWAGLIIIAPIEDPPPSVRFRDRGRVELANTAGLVDPNGSFTAEMWVRWPRDKTTQYFISNKVWPGMSPKLPTEQSRGWVLRTRGGGGLDFTAATPGAHGWWSAITDPRPNDGLWQHIAVSKTPEMVRIFWNGKLYGSRSLEGAKIVPSPTNMFLGVREHGHTDRRFDADVRAFRLSATALYDSDFTPEQSFQKKNDTLILMDFATGKGTRVVDHSGHRHHGTISGAHWLGLGAQVEAGAPAEVKLLSGGKLGVVDVGRPGCVEGPRVWKTISANLRGARFLRNRDKNQGTVHFRIVKSGRLLMACTGRWGGGGNPSGGWKSQIISRDQLLAQGWKPIDAELISHLPNHPQESDLRWGVFERFCQEGETFKYRTEKYVAPIVILDSGRILHGTAKAAQAQAGLAATTLTATGGAAQGVRR